MSLITKQIKRLREYADNRKGEIADICREAADTIENLSEKVRAANMERSSAYYNGGWIPVNDNLPKAGEYDGDVAKYYLVQNEYGEMLVASYTHSEDWEQIHQSYTIEEEIVAWMPLPKPYKSQESEG